MKLPFLILPAAFLLLGVTLVAEETPKKDLIILDEAGVKNLRLETSEALESDFEQTVLALGRIEVFPGKRHVISSRIPGRAVKVNVKPDQSVKPETSS